MFQYYFSRGIVQFDKVKLSVLARAKFKDLKEYINEKFNSFEKEIDQAVIDAKEMSWDAADKLYGNFICTRSNGEAKLYMEWHKIHLHIDLAFKDVSKKLDISYDWVCGCVCSKCKLAKSIYEKKM